MLEGGNGLNQRQDIRRIPVWCARFNTSQYQEAELVHLGETRLVLFSDVPFLPRTSLFIRLRPDSGAGNAQPFSAIIRSVGIAEVKWCRRRDYDSGRMYEMGVCYFESFA